MTIRHTWRLNAAFGLLLIALGALGVRLAWVIRHHGPHAAQQVSRQQRMTIPLPARTGSIFARTRGRHVLLAGSQQAPAIFADSALLRDPVALEQAAAQLAPILHQSPDAIQLQLLARWPSRYIILQSELDDEQLQAVRDLNIRAIGVTHQWRRRYPHGELASTVLGFRRYDGDPGAGLEVSQQGHLRAIDGQRVLLADAFRRPVWNVDTETRQPQDGASVFLTVDAVIQGFLEDAVQETAQRYGAEWATGVVVDPHTGDILAMASAPRFNPNAYSSSNPDHWINRAIAMPYEPGSILKTIFAAVAVQMGEYTWDSRIFCENGQYRVPRGGTIRDSGNSRHGWLTLSEVLVHSSNIGMAKLAEKLGNATLHEIANSWGFGQRSGIPLPGESPGILRDLELWDGYSIRVAFGQEISSTALQMAMAYAAIANGGRLMEPRLVQHVTDARGEVVYRSEPQVVRRVLDEAVARQTVDVLRQVVERPGGRQYRLSQWTSWGKTGTAQVAGVGGYNNRDYTSSYVGGAPATEPAVVCIISVYKPDAGRGYYGSQVAAPYVARVMEQTLNYLQVPPDRPGSLASGR